MNRTIVKKTINSLCLNSGLSVTEFEDRICNSINSSSDEAKFPATSTIDRWYNGNTVPSEKWYPHIAKALGITEVELVGSFEEEYTRTIAELTRRLNIRDEEKNLVEKAVWLDGEGLIILAALLFEVGSILFNATYYRNGVLYLISIIAIVLTVRFFNKKFPDPKDYKTIGQKAKGNIAFISRIIKLGRERSVLFGMFSTYFFIVCLIAFLPAIESCFYKGTFGVSISVYAFTSICTLIRGLYNR